MCLFITVPLEVKKTDALFTRKGCTSLETPPHEAIWPLLSEADSQNGLPVQLAVPRSDQGASPPPPPAGSQLTFWKKWDLAQPHCAAPQPP